MLLTSNRNIAVMVEFRLKPQEEEENVLPVSLEFLPKLKKPSLLRTLRFVVEDCAHIPEINHTGFSLYPRLPIFGTIRSQNLQVANSQVAILFDYLLRQAGKAFSVLLSLNSQVECVTQILPFKR